MEDDREPNPSTQPAKAPDPGQELFRRRTRIAEAAPVAPADRVGDDAPPPAMADRPEAQATGVPVPPAPPVRRDSPRANSFAERLRLSGRHPVLVFGTSTSGKSTLLVSLFHCLSKNRDINVRLGEPIFDVGTAAGRATHDQATDLFDRRVSAFEEGVVLNSTFLEHPFFVPVDVQPRGQTEPIRFAFMEARGEWFDPSQEDTGSIYRAMKEEIAEVLRNYPDAISVIHVAPYSILDDTNASTRESDKGLNGAIKSYLKHRDAKDQDFHLFLLTKWDQCAAPMKDSPRFSRVRAAEIKSVLNARYPRAWAEYHAMPLNGPVVRRYFMQYAAGHIRDGVVWDPPERHKHTFDRYPRTLWNWLYGNATEEKEGDALSFSRRILFRDVASRDGTHVTFIERITSFVRLR